MCRIAYYAHSEGSGHCRYADYVAGLLGGEPTIYTSRRHDFAPGRRVRYLSPEDVLPADQPRYLINTPPHLHYSPVGLASIRARAVELLSRLQAERTDVVIVDVSAEVAGLLRCASVPYVYVRMFGERSDPGHVAAYRGAVALVAYYPEELEAVTTPGWLRAKTYYLGFRPVAPGGGPAPRPLRADRGRLVLVATGYGRCPEVEAALPALRRRFAGDTLVGVGNLGPEAAGYLDRYLGPVDDLPALLPAADVVVGVCGSNLTAEVVRAGRPFVPLPCARPFREQEAMAEALVAAGAGNDLAAVLSGTAPAAPPPALVDRLNRSDYARFFRALGAATDWRQLLNRNLLNDARRA